MSQPATPVDGRPKGLIVTVRVANRRYAWYTFDEPEHVCCDEMKQAIDRGFVTVGEIMGICNSSINLNITRVEWENTVYMAIWYCPFCGLKITIKEAFGRDPERT